jgi:hypothetical protein
MAEIFDSLSPAEAPGVRVSLDQGTHVASLRYFDSNGVFSRTLQTVFGVPFPERLRATYASPRTGVDRAVLVWRSPTETLMLCKGPNLISQIQADTARLQDGCVIDQTGGSWVLRASGDGAAGLFARMGGQATLPMIGEARRSRLADVPVLALQVQLGEILLIVERVYAEHMMTWLRAIATY